MKQTNNNKSLLKCQTCFCLFFFLTTFYLLHTTSLAYAQTDPRSAIVSGEASDQRITELRQQIEALEKEAEQYRGNIAGEQAKAKSLKGEITILENQIKKLQTQISITSKNINKTEIEIEGLEGNIFDTQQKINYKKDTIGRLLLTLYKQDNENTLTILLKNANISDFFTQTQATSNLNTTLLGIVTELKDEKEDLEADKLESETKKEELENLNQKQKQQNSSLGQTKTGKNQLLVQTKGQEAQYQKMLAEVERKKSLFFTELKELETKIIQGGLYILRVTATNLPKKGTKLFVWPEEDYKITQGYGCTTYARCNRARGPYGGAPHNGIDMASGYGSPLKAIGDGEIVANGKNDGWGNWIAIKHPPYNLVSVYGHLSAFEFLQVGTQVKAGQTIGYEGATGNSTGSHLHLSVYKEFFTYLKDKNGQLYFNYFEGSVNPLDYL
ncbi:MAG: peptidoglycan DD-metalloendopeptidase family protein [Candidatus Taylorbacteria bacterium]|nr:peptidoglycan DD-metalloendopeptidase family protein [Candidatus Taylorbacteria bacterium]